MKYVDFLELQKEYESRKEFISAMYRFVDNFYNDFHGKDFYCADLQTVHLVKKCYDLLIQDIERVKKELNEMEV